MSEKTTITCHYTPSQLRGLLSKFQDAIDRKQYSEKIPYDTWRKMMRITDDVQIDFVNPFVKIFNPKDNNVIYSAKTYDWGFGRFFYDYVVKEKHTMGLSMKADYMQASDKAMSAATAVSATNCTKADVTALEWKADYMQASDRSSILADKIYTYDSDSTTGVANYGTSITDAVKVSGGPLQTNTIELNIPSLDQFGYHQINGTWNSVASKSDMEDRFKKLEAELQKKVDKVEKTECVKENDTMMKGINFDFGPCGSTVRMSMYGMAIQNISGEWVSYNPATQEIVNVDVFNIPDGGKYMYKMPVAISEIAIGDIVVHNRKPAFVTSISADGKSLGVVDPYAGERKDIMLTRSPFGFNFATKVISLFGAFGSAPTAEAPFGNMLPFLMMSEGNGGDIDPMLMYMMMQGQNGFKNGFMNGFNPMMMYFLMKDGAKDINPFMMAMMMNAGAVPTQVVTNAVKPVEQV